MRKYNQYQQAFDEIAQFISPRFFKDMTGDDFFSGFASLSLRVTIEFVSKLSADKDTYAKNDVFHARIQAIGLVYQRHPP